MNALINLVLALVLNFLSYGTNHPDVAQVTYKNALQVTEKKSYRLEDLRSHSLITKEEVTENLVRIN